MTTRPLSNWLLFLAIGAIGAFLAAQLSPTELSANQEEKLLAPATRPTEIADHAIASAPEPSALATANDQDARAAQSQTEADSQETKIETASTPDQTQADVVAVARTAGAYISRVEDGLLGRHCPARLNGSFAIWESRSKDQGLLAAEGRETMQAALISAEKAVCEGDPDWIQVVLEAAKIAGEFFTEHAQVRHGIEAPPFDWEPGANSAADIVPLAIAAVHRAYEALTGNQRNVYWGHQDRLVRMSALLSETEPVEVDHLIVGDSTAVRLNAKRLSALSGSAIWNASLAATPADLNVRWLDTVLPGRVSTPSVLAMGTINSVDDVVRTSSTVVSNEEGRYQSLFRHWPEQPPIEDWFDYEVTIQTDRTNWEERFSALDNGGLFRHTPGGAQAASVDKIVELTTGARISPERLAQTLEMARSQTEIGREVVFILLPINPLVQSAREAAGDNLVQMTQDLVSQLSTPDSSVLDLSSGFGTEHFEDGVHLNEAGAKRAEALIIEFLDGQVD